jgi:hypothetical protein
MGEDKLGLVVGCGRQSFTRRISQAVERFAETAICNPLRQ